MYAPQWNRFRSWCEERGVDPLDVDPVQVAAYLVERAETRKLSTVQASAAAIAAAARAGGWADPTKTPLVDDTLRGIARQHAAVPEEAPRQAAALDYATANELLGAAGRPQRRGRGRETPATAAARGRRDAAILSTACGEFVNVTCCIRLSERPPALRARAHCHEVRRRVGRGALDRTR